MPNWRNIRGPITLIGNGRSGTSLISQLFSHHPDGTYVGETANLIHTVYHALDNSLPGNKKEEIPDVIRGSFNYLYPSKEEFWFHKPIGIPMAHNYFPDRDEFHKWYWTVFDKVFPHASYFTVLRNPLDVIISSRKWWGRDYSGIILSIQQVADLVLHPESKVEYAVSYDDLIKKKKTKTKELFKYLGIPFHENCMKAFEQKYVARDPNSEEIDKEAKRIANLKEIPEGLITEEFKEIINRCYDKFELPHPNWDIKGIIDEYETRMGIVKEPKETKEVEPAKEETAKEELPKEPPTAKEEVPKEKAAKEPTSDEKEGDKTSE